MDVKQNPFSLYDFLGYFTPGAIFLVSIYLSLIHGHIDPDITQHNIPDTTGFLYFTLILLSYVVGHLLSFVSSITIEKYSIWSVGYPSKYLIGAKSPSYFDVKEPKTLRCFVRGLVFLLILPVSLFDVLVGHLLKMRELYAKSLDPVLEEAVTSKTETLLHTLFSDEIEKRFEKSRKDFNPMDSDFFRVVYHYALENAPSHRAKMQNYVSLYGFLRTITLICVIHFWFFFIHIANGKMAWGWAIPFSFLCYLFFMAFVKFYRRFSLEALMAITVSR